METYKQMKDRHQSEVNALPLAFAFSDKQYKKQLEAWNITEEEAAAGAIVGIGGGGFIRTSDREKVISTFNRIREEERAAIAADPDGSGYIFEMFYTELLNHEYRYTLDPAETLDELGIDPEELQKNKALKAGLEKAIAKIEKKGDIFD